jgi:anaerobic selenocysteine-containing dehydrogenase
MLWCRDDPLHTPRPALWDVRYANDAWLLRLPRPWIKLTQDNPLLVSPAIAERLKLEDGDRVTVANGGPGVTLPARIMPGLAPDCIVALLGFGRTDVAVVGQGRFRREVTHEECNRPPAARRMLGGMNRHINDPRATRRCPTSP